MYLINTKDLIFKGILIVQIMLVIDATFYVFHLESSQALSLIRYVFYFFGVYWIFKGLKDNHQHTSFLCFLFLLWNSYLILTSLPKLSNPMQNHVIFKQFISGKLFLYTLPFLICAEVDTSFFKMVFRLSYIMLIAYIILAIPVYYSDSTFITNGQSEYITFLAEGSIMLLFTFPYHRRKKIIHTTMAVLIAIIVMMLLARRNKVVFYGGGLGLAIILNVLKGNLNSKTKAFIIFSTLAGMVFIFNSGSLFDAFFNKMETGMSSRDQVIDDFFSDFNRTPSDWIFGRGLFGEFDAGLLNNNENTGLRDAIENGYLQHILKGGWIWLGLFILISIRSIYQGLFQSNNIFVKGCALLLLLYFLDMIGFGVPVPSLKYILVFLSISVCSSRRWRNYTDNELQKQLAI